MVNRVCWFTRDHDTSQLSMHNLVFDEKKCWIAKVIVLETPRQLLELEIYDLIGLIIM